ncbi:MAG: polysaccharide biosynthesis/export family protein [Rikenellaceae bacterium]
MLKFRNLLILLLFCLSTSCRAYKDIPYLQDVNRVSPSTSITNETRIVKNDILTIVVSASDSDIARPFNAMRPLTGESSTGGSSNENYLDYTVDNNGEINFPVVGKIYVLDMTTSEVSDIIVEILKDYLVERPVVDVKIADFKVSVLGEVNTPGVLLIPSGKVNIFEALAMSGDMTIYGQRYNVKLIRELEEGKKQVVSLDLNDVNIVDTPYYYLCQNDVIYVSPNKTQGNASVIGTSRTIWLSVTTTMLSVASVVLAVIL